MWAIPYRSQHDPDSRGFRADCGPACVAMILDSHGLHFTIDALSKETSLVTGVSYSTLPQLVAMLRKRGFAAIVKTTTPQDLLTDIQAGPVIALINYSRIKERQDTGYTDGHFVVIRAIYPALDQIVINDPDWWGSRRSEGNGLTISYEAFLTALRDADPPFRIVSVQGGPSIMTVKAFVDYVASLPANGSTTLAIDGKSFTVSIGELQTRLGTTPLQYMTMLVNSPNGLKLRAQPSTSASVLRILVNNEAVVVSTTIVATANGYTWRKVQSGGYVAAEFLRSRPVPAPTRTRWVGHHFASGLLMDGVLDIIGELAQAGKDDPLIVSVNRNGFCKAIKDRSPRTITVARHHPDGHANIDDPVGWFNQQWAALRNEQGVDYYQLTNEWGQNFYDTAEGCAKMLGFWHTLMNMAQNEGIKITILDLAVGWLKDERDVAATGAYNALAAMRPVLDRAASLGFPLNYHAYPSKDDIYAPLGEGWEYNAGRWINWFKQIPGLLLIGGEVGPHDTKDKDGVDAHYRGDADYVRIMTDYDTLVRESGFGDRVLGLAYWTASPDDRWLRFNIDSGMPAYKQYMLKG